MRSFGDACIHESQQEANALSIQEALRKGPSKKLPANDDASGVAAKPDKGAKDGKGKGKSLKVGKMGKGNSIPAPRPAAPDHMRNPVRPSLNPPT